uniref:Heme utilization protein n=1 Tax=Ascaris lumbricoides TaxID=6252 RepID=A0A0M3HJE6_ASCLU
MKYAFIMFYVIAFSARAHSIKGSVTSGAGKVTQTAMSGTKSVAHEVVTHTKSAAGEKYFSFVNFKFIIATE